MSAITLAEVLKRDEISGKLESWLDEEVMEGIQHLPAVKLGEKLEHVMQAPISFGYPHVFDWMTARWVAEQTVIFERLGIAKGARTLEIASGDQVAVPLAVECFSGGAGSYTTANLNKKLTEHFKQTALRLSIDLDVIEADAADIGEYEPAETFDAVVFLHAVNDIVQTIAAEQIGLDTVHSDWYDILPAMVQELASRHRNRTLEATVKNEFLSLLSAVTDVTKTGGILIFTHWEYAYDLELGYPADLYRSFVELARSWILSSDLPLEEVALGDFDPQYRLVVRKVKYA